MARNHKRLFFRVLFAFIATLLVAVEVQAATDVQSVRLWRAPDSTRIVFDLSNPVSHNVFSLENPHRLVIDIDNARFRASLDDLSLSDTPVKKIRTGSRGDNGLRVVLDLREKVSPHSFVLAKHGGKLDRLVLDLEDRQADSQREPAVRDHSDEERRDIVIAIDAGHGGEDPGAISAQRVYEKDIVLDIAKRLAKLMDDTPGFHPELVRTGDYYIALQKRRELARQKRADLFVSIHADAFHHTSAHGASVFALSSRGAKATSDTARYLAQQENSADLIGGVGSVSLNDKDQMLAEVLVDLSMTHTLSSSLQVGDFVLKSMGGLARLHKKQVEQANFSVLRSPDMPSLLVETGFISNPGEAKRLTTPQYRQQMAEKIFAGIKAYYTEVPPPGTYIAWQKRNGGGASEHVISRGETLSAIARRYNVTVSDILTMNGLSDTAIQVGQRLKIPTS